MICPYCNHDQGMVIDSRQVEEIRRRKYECAACHKRFRTIERVTTLGLPSEKRIREGRKELEELTELLASCAERLSQVAKLLKLDN